MWFTQAAAGTYPPPHARQRRSAPRDETGAPRRLTPQTREGARRCTIRPLLPSSCPTQIGTPPSALHELLDPADAPVLPTLELVEGDADLLERLVELLCALAGSPYLCALGHGGRDPRGIDPVVAGVGAGVTRRTRSCNQAPPSGSFDSAARWMTASQPSKCAGAAWRTSPSISGTLASDPANVHSRSGRCPSRRSMPSRSSAGTITDPMQPLWPVTRTRMALPFSRWVSLFRRIDPAPRGTIDTPGSSLMLCHVGRRAARDGRKSDDHRESAVGRGGGVPVLCEAPQRHRGRPRDVTTLRELPARATSSRRWRPSIRSTSTCAVVVRWGELTCCGARHRADRRKVAGDEGGAVLRRARNAPA